MIWDIFIAAGVGFTQLVITWYAVDISVREKRLKNAFIIGIIGAVGIGLTVWGAIRSGAAQAELQAQLDKIQKNTENPPHVTVNVPPQPNNPVRPPRSYLAVDGYPLFTGPSPTPTEGSNFQVGSQLGFNVHLHVVGHNPVYAGANAMLTVLIRSLDPQSLKGAYNTFLAEMAAGKKRDPHFKESWSMWMLDEKEYNTAYVMDGPLGHGTVHLVTQNDLDDLRQGNEIAVTMVFYDYKDGNTIHHLWYCAFLQPPSQPPGIWHSFDAFPSSD